MQVQSTGPQRVQLLQLRTKETAVHAGHSPPPEPSNLPSSLLVRDSPTFLNHNWLTALHHMETMDATEDGWTTPSSTSQPTDRPQNKTTPTLPSKPDVNRLRSRVSSRSPDSPMSLKMTVQDYGLLWSNNPSPLLLMQATGPHTPVVSSPTVLLN